MTGKQVEGVLGHAMRLRGIFEAAQLGIGGRDLRPVAAPRSAGSAASPGALRLLRGRRADAAGRPVCNRARGGRADADPARSVRRMGSHQAWPVFQPRRGRVDRRAVIGLPAAASAPMSSPGCFTIICSFRGTGGRKRSTTCAPYEPVLSPGVEGRFRPAAGVRRAGSRLNRRSPMLKLFHSPGAARWCRTSRAGGSRRRL